MYKELDIRIMSEIIMLANNQFQCPHCEYWTVQRSRIINHMESKHLPGPGISCEVCHKHHATRHSYRMHYDRNHKDRTQQMDYTAYK